MIEHQNIDLGLGEVNVRGTTLIQLWQQYYYFFVYFFDTTVRKGSL